MQWIKTKDKPITEELIDHDLLIVLRFGVPAFGRVQVGEDGKLFLDYGFNVASVEDVLEYLIDINLMSKMGEALK